MNNFYSPSVTFSEVKQENEFLSRTYFWMVAGLLISGLVAFAVANVPSLTRLVFGTPLYIVLIVAEFVLVFFLSAKIRTIEVSTATFSFLLYSAVNGAVLSSVFIAYPVGHITRCFFITAAIFAVMAVVGMTTKKSLASVGHYCSMALFGVIIASLVNFFMKSSQMDYLISLVAVVIFTGLTAYDSQKILKIARNADDGDSYKKIAIIGALNLYLDFINIFLRLLRLMNKSKK